jgi:hypothetical protein
MLELRLQHWRTLDRTPSYSKNSLGTNIRYAVALHQTLTDRIRNIWALIGNPRSSQQLMGQLVVAWRRKSSMRGEERKYLMLVR